MDTEQSYSEIVKESLHLKICLKNKAPSGSDLKTITNFLNNKIIEALDYGGFIPIFYDNELGNDGMYLKCSDYACANWLRNVIKEAEAATNLNLIVLKHDEKPMVPNGSDHVRVVTCIPTRRDYALILNTMAKLNKNLNTEKWRIAKHRFKGATKMTLYMRMDKQYFEAIKAQNNQIFWLLGHIDITLERSGINTNNNNSSETQVAAKRNVEQGDHSFNQKVGPSSRGVWNGYPTTKGQVRNDRSGSSGMRNPNN